MAIFSPRCFLASRSGSRIRFVSVTPFSFPQEFLDGAGLNFRKASLAGNFQSCESRGAIQALDHRRSFRQRRQMTAHWPGVYDDNGRLMGAICPNMDLGDSWENADDPKYPERFSALGIRIGVDYIIYAMTHRSEERRVGKECRSR